MSNGNSTSLIHPKSLGDTLDEINTALFENRPLTAAERSQAITWIADRQGLPGSYAGMFAPTDYDYAFGTLTFTGEPVRSAAGTAHLLSEEACGALFRLGVSSEPEALAALKRARQNIFHRMDQSEVQGKWSGVYCCAMCTVSLWRHLLASGEPDDQRRLEHGLAELYRSRDGQGRWRRFPFYYTLLALNEIPLPAVQQELHYAEAVIERALRRLVKQDPDEQDRFDQRRRVVMQNVLERC